MASPWKIAVASLYWWATTVWLLLLGRHLGALMALHSPESDRAALVLLLAGPPLLALLQPLAAGSPKAAFLRTALLTAAFTIPLVHAAGSRLEAVPWWLVAAHAAGCGALGALSARLARFWRVARRAGPLRRLTGEGGFVLLSLAGGVLLAAVSRIYLWHARRVRPGFDPVEFPSPYSETMAWWAYGFLGLSFMLAVGILVMALRIQSPGNVNTG